MTSSTHIQAHRATRASRRLRRTAVVVLGGGVLVLGTPLAAMAHVEMTADTTAAGSEAVLTLSIPHGCEGSPTTRLTMAVPAGITEVTPTVEAGWTVTKTTEKLDQPLTLDDGDQITERTSQVVWTAREPLADGFRAEISLGIGLPATAAGQTLSFPIVQTCEKGETDWDQVAGAGVDEEDLEHPAPSVTVTAATGEAEEGHHHDGAETGSAEGSEASPAGDGETVTAVSTDAAGASSSDGDGTAVGLGLAGLVAGLLGLGAGVTALVRSRGAAPSRQR